MATLGERAEILCKALPKRIRVGPHDYVLEILSVVESEVRNIDGHHSPREGAIRVAAGISTPTRLAAILLHECLHAMYDNSALSDEDNEERTVDALATGLVALFRDNDWLAGWIAGAVK